MAARKQLGSDPWQDSESIAAEVSSQNSRNDTQILKAI